MIYNVSYNVATWCKYNLQVLALSTIVQEPSRKHKRRFAWFYLILQHRCRLDFNLGQCFFCERPRRRLEAGFRATTDFD